MTRTEIVIILVLMILMIVIKSVQQYLYNLMVMKVFSLVFLNISSSAIGFDL